MPNLTLTTRRGFLVTAAAGSAVLVGCSKSTENEPSKTSAPTVRRDVPLRVLLCGNDRWADVLRTSWSAIADQPLQINVLDSRSIDAEQWQGKVVEAMKACDVAIVSTGLLPALDAAAALTPLSDDTFASDGATPIVFFPVLREGTMKFGGRTVAAPLGALQPSLVLRTDGPAAELEIPKDWEAYIASAKKLNDLTTVSTTDPIVAEPLADGAAAQMFLWRVNSASPPVWLFDRDSFKPVISSEPYVVALETMKRCVDLYRGARLTAGEVWSRVATGKLQMAIAWPATHSATERIEEASDCVFAALPADLAPNTSTERWRPTQTLVDISSPIAVLSSQCRQSIAAKRFLNWMIGGDGTSMIRSVVTGLTDLRRQQVTSGSSPDGGSTITAESGNEADDARRETGTTTYGSVLAQSLSSLTMRTPLQLLEYRKYAKSLDAAVLACLDGEQSAQESLNIAAKTWAELTDQIGVKEQAKAWRKSQGLRS